LVRIYTEPRALIGVLNLLALSTSILISICIGYYTYKKLKSIYEDWEPALAASITTTILLAIVLGILTYSLTNAILSIYYPKYMAIEALLDKFLAIK